MSHFTLRQTPQPIQWATLLGASVVCVAAFELMRLPAALMLGAIGAAILLCYWLVLFWMYRRKLFLKI